MTKWKWREVNTQANVDIVKEFQEEEGCKVHINMRGDNISKLKHIEVEGAIVNIRTGLRDVKGRKVTSVEILPDDHYMGENIWKTYPHVRNVRIVQLKKKLRWCDYMAYKIKWKDGGTTAEAYSSKALAEKILNEIKHKGTVIKCSLSNPPCSPLSGRKTVWVRSKPFSGVKGFVYHTRAISALSKAEKKRVVK